MSTELEQQEEVKNDLLSFDWEDSNDVFFGIGSSGEPVEVEPEKPKGKQKNEEPQEPPVEEPADEEEEEDDFFTEADKESEKLKKKLGVENDNEEGDETPDNGGNQEPSVYLDLYKDLKDIGVFKHTEVEEGEDLDAETFLELQQQEYDAEIKERLVSWANEELDEDAKAFIKFKTEGGNTQDFFNVLQNASSIPTGDIEDEGYQDQVIRYQLAKEGWPSDEIEDRLEYWTENGKKSSVAKRYDAKLKTEVEQQKAEAVKQAELKRQAVKEQEEDFRDTIKSTLETATEFSGFKISKPDKEKILRLLTKKEHKVGEGQYITGFQKKFAETLQDTNKLILLTKILDSDFNMSDLEKQIATRKTKQIKTNLEQRRSLRPSGSGSSSQGVHIADLFN